MHVLAAADCVARVRALAEARARVRRLASVDALVRRRTCVHALVRRRARVLCAAADLRASQRRAACVRAYKGRLRQPTLAFACAGRNTYLPSAPTFVRACCSLRACVPIQDRPSRARWARRNGGLGLVTRARPGWNGAADQRRPRGPANYECWFISMRQLPTLLSARRPAPPSCSSSKPALLALR